MRGDGATRATEQDEDAACDDDLGTAEAVHKSGHEVSFAVGGDVSVAWSDLSKRVGLGDLEKLRELMLFALDM